MFYSREDRFHNLTADDAYRSWLISRNQAPIVFHSGEMHWKRLRVLARRTGNHIRGFFAAIPVALVADKTRRAQRLLALHGLRHARIDKPRAGQRRPS